MQKARLITIKLRVFAAQLLLMKNCKKACRHHETAGFCLK
jgi:hypothetical protein